jgi:ornithine decarboxylase
MVGTGANDPGSFRKAIKGASAVFEQAQTLGFNMRLLDIGGGFQDKNFEDIAASIREEIAQRIPSTTKIIAEPGRYYARSAYTLICRVISRRRQIIEKAKDLPDMLYQNDGLYGHFMNRLMEAENFCPILVLDRASSGKREAGPHRYTIWGPTCDGGDYVVRDTTLPCEAKVGDWLKYKNMGGKLDINCEAAFSCLMLTVSKHTLVQQRLNSTASRVIVRLYISTVTPWF